MDRQHGLSPLSTHDRHLGHLYRAGRFILCGCQDGGNSTTGCSPFASTTARDHTPGPVPRPGREPLAAGMAAVLPHVDAFVEGHSLAAPEPAAPEQVAPEQLAAVVRGVMSDA